MKRPASAVFRMLIFPHSAVYDAMKNKNKTILPFLCGLFLLFVLCACGENLLLPTGGYDYLMSGIDGAVLGYPIPRNAPNPYCYDRNVLSGKLTPTAFVYDADHMEYAPLTVTEYSLPIPDGAVLAYAAETERGRTYFASADTHAAVMQGDIGGNAVVLADGVLYLAAETGARAIAETVRDVFSVHSERKCLLLCDSAGLLYEYRDDFGEDTTYPISDGMPVADAWYAYGAEAHTVVFRTEDGVWYCTEDGGIPTACVYPEKEAAHARVHVRGTVCILQGSSDTAHFYDVRTGDVLDMDMGGLYRFPYDTDTVSLPLSPDGMFVYFYDIDYIYRLNLVTAALDLAYNEAPIFEGVCVLSSMTAVTDEIVLLSQAANEYTEYVAVITCAVFEEDIPDVRHEYEKIDLDCHPWETDT